MLRYLMGSCVLFDYIIICFFQGHYLIVIKYLEKKRKSTQINVVTGKEDNRQNEM